MNVIHKVLTSSTLGCICNLRIWNYMQPLKVLSSSIYSRLLVMIMNSENTINSSSNDVLMPPPTVYEMKILNRDDFKKQIKVPTLNIPIEKFKASLKVLKPCLLKMHNLHPVQGDDKEKKVLLNPVLYDEKLPYLEDTLKKLGLNNAYWSDLTLTYDNFNHEAIFKAVLPSDTGGSVSSFSIIGHIIHLNLKPYLMDYKYVIGEVFLDKYHNIKTVVNKSQTIETEYRNFQMELLAGVPIYDVIVKENGFQYAFNFEKVFWNPRLVQEHAEIVKKIKPGDVVFDIFAGVGPFSIPIAKKTCTVYANDLNPDSYKWLCHNAKLNKVSDNLTAYNLDGREFIYTVVKENIVKLWSEAKECSIHIIMNLPAAALEFLEAFQGLLKDFKFSSINMPIVYCYFFLKKDEEVEEIIEKYFDMESRKNIHVALVRAVAPNKKMMRITYRIPESTLFYSDEPAVKKQKII